MPPKVAIFGHFVKIAKMRNLSDTWRSREFHKIAKIFVKIGLLHERNPARVKNDKFLRAQMQEKIVT